MYEHNNLEDQCSYHNGQQSTNRTNRYDGYESKVEFVFVGNRFRNSWRQGVSGPMIKVFTQHFLKGRNNGEIPKRANEVEQVQGRMS
jgi:hypothetical protein